MAQKKMKASPKGSISPEKYIRLGRANCLYTNAICRRKFPIMA